MDLITQILSCAIGVGAQLVSKVGLEDEILDLKNRITGKEEKKRREAFNAAFEKARDSTDCSELQSLFHHRPFQEEVAAALLDPNKGFSVQRTASDFIERYPPRHARNLNAFFSNLQSTLMFDATWGPILERFSELQYRKDIQEHLRNHNFPLTSHELVQHVSREIKQNEADAALSRNVSKKSQSSQRIIHVVVQNLILGNPVQLEVNTARDKYLLDLAKDSNMSPLTHIDPFCNDLERGTPLRLSDIFTDLDTTEHKHMENEHDLRDFMKSRHLHERISAFEAINKRNRLLIMGDPGSGKSTFVKFIAYVLANAGLDSEPDNWLQKLSGWSKGALLPVRIELRVFADSISANLKNRDATPMLNFLRDQLANNQVAEFWSEFDNLLRMEEHQIVFLFDGLDEVPQERISVVVTILNKFVNQYPSHRYVVTSRPYANLSLSVQLSGFHEATLAPFNPKQIRQFIQNWFVGLAQHNRISPEDEREMKKGLLEAIKKQDLQELAERPLLLSMMALLPRRGRKLPRDRTKLYDEIIKLFMLGWEQRLGEESDISKRFDLPELRDSDLEAALFKVAYQAHKNLPNTESEADIRDTDLRAWLAEFLGGSYDKAKVLIEYIHKRAGLLIPRKLDTYTFPHRTFQEFLAGCYLVTEKTSDFPNKAASLVKEDFSRWHEVFVLACGYAARNHPLSSAISAVDYISRSMLSNFVEYRPAPFTWEIEIRGKKHGT